jgi:hypothetical protein
VDKSAVAKADRLLPRGALAAMNLGRYVDGELHGPMFLLREPPADSGLVAAATGPPDGCCSVSVFFVSKLFPKKSVRVDVAR